MFSSFFFCFFFGRDLSRTAERLQKMNETPTLQEPPAVPVCISPTFPLPLPSQRWLAPGERSLLVPVDTTGYWNPHLELLYVLFFFFLPPNRFFDWAAVCCCCIRLKAKSSLYIHQKQSPGRVTTAAGLSCWPEGRSCVCVCDPPSGQSPLQPAAQSAKSMEEKNKQTNNNKKKKTTNTGRERGLGNCPFSLRKDPMWRENKRRSRW